MEAHSGFLNSAKALLPLLIEKLKVSAEQGASHVMFTGHSAGGAVASLLYAHCQADSVLASTSAHVSEQKLSSWKPQESFDSPS